MTRLGAQRYNARMHRIFEQAKINKARYADVTVERIPHNGHLVLSAMIDGELYRHVYIGYGRRTAIRLFREEMARGKQ